MLITISHFAGNLVVAVLRWFTCPQVGVCNGCLVMICDLQVVPTYSTWKRKREGDQEKKYDIAYERIQRSLTRGGRWNTIPHAVLVLKECNWIISEQAQGFSYKPHDALRQSQSHISHSKCSLHAF